MPTFDTPQPIDATIELAVGDVRVSASDRTDTVVVVEPTDPDRRGDVEAAAATTVEYSDGRLLVRAQKQWKRFSPFGPSGMVRVAVELPTGSTVSASSAMGDLFSDGELGDCQLKTAHGNIRVDQTGKLQLKTSHGKVAVDRALGDVDITTSSGEVVVGDVHGTAAIKNSNGATRVGLVTGDIRVKASNGDITIERAHASVTAKSAIGDIRVDEVRRGVVVLETSTGGIACGVATGTAAWLDVHSGHGRVRSSLEVTSGPGEGEETVELRARTTVGDITIDRVPVSDRPTRP